MADAVSINITAGGKAERLARAEVTLASGTGTINTPFTQVNAVVLTQKDATAVADGVSWSATGTPQVVTVDSSNGSSAETYSAIIIGF